MGKETEQRSQDERGFVFFFLLSLFTGLHVCRLNLYN
jgi:hypothetical protein